MNPENLYDHDVKYISAMGSIAHTYGNLLATIQKWVLDIFPKNFFKTIRINSQIAHKQMLSTPYQFLKNSKPMIIFNPRIAYDDRDTFLANTLLTSRMGGPLTSKTPGITELHPFILDPENGINLQFSETRRVMNLDVVITFGSFIEQTNYREFLMGELDFNRFFDIPTFLEAFIPKELLEVISSLNGIPVHDKDGSIHDFLKYLNDHSVYPVTYKLGGSTGKEEFYRYYPTKILTKIENLDSNTGETVGQITKNYQISFSMRLEFWSPITNYLFSERIKERPNIEVSSDASIIPIYADVFALEDLRLAPGWQMHSYTSYILDKPNDSVSFKDILETSIRELITYCITNAIPIVNFFGIRIRRQGDLLEEHIDYTIDYSTFTVNFKNTDFGWYTYNIIAVIDVGVINEMIKDIFHLE